MTAESSPTKRKKAFVVSPIGAPGSDVYRKAAYALKYIFRVALPEDEWEVHRADEGKSPDSIGQHVIKQIYEADLVIADLTGHNPNVFYELAIAHGWRRPVVHLISQGENVPFDIVDQRTIFYDITDLASVESTVATLREYADHAIENADDLVTPLKSFEKFNQIRADDGDGGSAVAEVLEELVSRLSRLETRLGGRNEPRLRPLAAESLSMDEMEQMAARYGDLVSHLMAMDLKDDSELSEGEKELRANMERQVKGYAQLLPSGVVHRIVQQAKRDRAAGRLADASKN